MTIKDYFQLEDDTQDKNLAYYFKLFTEIERKIISQRTKEALARKRAEGIVLGRPKGSKSAQVKLSGHEAEIQTLLDAKVPKSVIAHKYGVCRKTVFLFIKNRL